MNLSEVIPKPKPLFPRGWERRIYCTRPLALVLRVTNQKRTLCAGMLMYAICYIVMAGADTYVKDHKSCRLSIKNCFFKIIIDNGNKEDCFCYCKTL